MPLTPENMESKPSEMSYTIFRDIARMDEEQLRKYVTMAFTNHRDLTFLPEPFWDYWFEMGKHGPEEELRFRSSPAEFFASVHNLLASVKMGTFQLGEPNEDKPDFAYRPRFRKVLDGILDDWLNIQGDADNDQKQLLEYAIEATGNLRLPDIQNNHTEPTSSEDATPVFYDDELLADIDAQRKDQVLLQLKAEAIIKDIRFRQKN